MRPQPGKQQLIAVHVLGLPAARKLAVRGLETARTTATVSEYAQRARGSLLGGGSRGGLAVD
jgi:hypothetical protein